MQCKHNQTTANIVKNMKVNYQSDSVDTLVFRLKRKSDYPKLHLPLYSVRRIADTPYFFVHLKGSNVHLELNKTLFEQLGYNPTLVSQSFLFPLEL